MCVPLLSRAGVRSTAVSGSLRIDDFLPDCDHCVAVQMVELCGQQEGCRHQALLQCFGDSLPRKRCGTMCDLCCDKPHPLLPLRPGLAEKEADTHGAAANEPVKRHFDSGNGGKARGATGKRKRKGGGGTGAKGGGPQRGWQKRKK